MQQFSAEMFARQEFCHVLQRVPSVPRGALSAHCATAPTPCYECEPVPGATDNGQQLMPVVPCHVGAVNGANCPP